MSDYLYTHPYTYINQLRHVRIILSVTYLSFDLLLLCLDQAVKFVFHLRILFNHLVLALDLASGAKCRLCLASWRSCGLYWIQRVQDTLLVDLLD